jgi:hypothetical protein
MRLLHLALVAPEAREAFGGAEFQGFGLLLAGHCECALKVGSPPPERYDCNWTKLSNAPECASIPDLNSALVRRHPASLPNVARIFRRLRSDHGASIAPG